MTTTLHDIKLAIQSWNESRTSSETVIDLIAHGHFFHITREMYHFWQTKYPEGAPTYVHAYLGQKESNPNIGFFLIDSISDGNPEEVTVENIFYADYRYGFEELMAIPPFAAEGLPGMNVGILAGLERSFRWLLNRKKWIEDKVAEGTNGESSVFQVIHIPMSDLDSIFGEASAENAVVLFGLKAENRVELLSWSEDFKIHEDVEDVAFPVPPFSVNHPESSYQLLKLSLPS